MRIKPCTSGMETSFRVTAENDAELVLLTQFCRTQIRETHELHIGGHTWQNGATTDFNFGWVDKSKIAKPETIWRGFVRRLVRLRTGLLPGLFKPASS